MRLFLGIDGGQSSTTALIADETGKVLGMGRGGPCNHVAASEGRAKFLNAIGGCVEAACSQAGVNKEVVTFDSVCGGFSGGPADKEGLMMELVRARQMTVTTDAVIALSGAHAGKPGIITIAGTGSISYGRNAAKKIARAGGWGYVFGDEGGAFDIVRQAVRAALRHEEGWGPQTALSGLLLAETGAAGMNDLMHRFYTMDFPRPKIASFSKLVDSAALNGDAVARNILNSAAQELATITTAVRDQLFEAREAVFISPIGGVFHSGFLAQRFQMLVELTDGNLVHAPQYGPAAGAVIEALAAAGLAPELTTIPESEK